MYSNKEQNIITQTKRGTGKNMMITTAWFIIYFYEPQNINCYTLNLITKLITFNLHFQYAYLYYENFTTDVVEFEL